LLLCILSGCATTSSRVTSSRAMTPIMPSQPAAVSFAAVQHTVHAGETLWSISKAYGVNVNDIARANSLSDSTSISAGQVLSIPRPSKKYSGKTASYTKTTYPKYKSKGGSFVWPVEGSTLYAFGSKVNGGTNKGIDIKAPEGLNVRASRAGRVVYCDSQLKGFGKTVIIDHGDNYQTVYSYNSEILVKVGDEVSQNDTIAKVGKTGRAKEASLHFEIRKDGRPQNPTTYLTR